MNAERGQAPPYNHPVYFVQLSKEGHSSDEEYVSEEDPSVLHFLLNSGEEPYS